MGSHYFQIKPIIFSGVTVDPQIYCPANGFPNPNTEDFPEVLQNYPEALGEACNIAGYIDPTDPAQVEAAELIPNPIKPSDGWVLIATLQNNSPNTTTFDPTMSAVMGQYSYDLGDGSVMVGEKSVSHTYLTTAIRTVKIYGKGTCKIQNIDLTSDNLVGTVDFSNMPFNADTGSWSFYLNTNAGVVSVLFPTSPIGVCGGFSLTGCTAYIGIMDARIVTALVASSSGSSIQVAGNTTIQGILFAPVITGLINQLNLYNNSNMTEPIDVSMFKSFVASGGTISVYGNTKTPSITLPSSILAGNLSSISLGSNSAITTLDISGLNVLSNICQLYLDNNINLVTLTLPTSITGKLTVFSMYNNPKYVGTLNLSVFGTGTGGGLSGTLNLYGNTLMTQLILSPLSIGPYTTIDLHSSGFAGEVDLSMVGFSSNGTLDVSRLPAMTSLKLPATTMVGNLVYFSAYSTGLIGNLDLTKVNFGTSGSNINIYLNPNLTGISFSPTMVGMVTTLNLYSNNLSGTLDISMIKTFVSTGATIDIHGNANLTGITTPSVATTGVIAALYLYGCSFGYINLTKYSFARNNATIALDDCNLTTEQINHILVDLNNSQVGGYTGRAINIRNANAGIDSTTGGFDGISARNGLIAKGFTVNIVTVPIMGTTTAITGKTSTTANSGGSITNANNGIISEKGVCWKTSPNPTIADSRTSNGTGTSSFTSSLTGLTPNTTYYVRCYATNGAGTGYGTEISFTTLP